jgi:ATP-dependent helicase/nuclease subunit A
MWTTTMHEGPADAEARAAALDPTRSFIVEAAAGSGKTTLLTQRLLVLLARVAQPEEVVAITFTRKAAAEMRGRVLDALASAVEPDASTPAAVLTQRLARAVLTRDAQHGWHLRENPARLRIATIDAVTANLVRRLPLLIGDAGSRRVSDDASELYRRAARRTLLEAETEDVAWAAPVRQLLAHLDNDWRRAEQLLVDMLARRDQWLDLVGGPPDRARLAAGLEALVDAEFSALAEGCTPTLRTQLVALAHAAGRELQSRDGELSAPVLLEFSGAATDRAGWCAVAGLLLTQKGDLRARLDRRCGLPTDPVAADAYRACFADLAAALEGDSVWIAALNACRELPRTGYDDTQFELLTALFATLRVAAAHWAVASAEAQRTDFTEIALAALTALGGTEDPSDLALALDYRISHLLVDEFQDTSRLQYALLERLTAGWTGSDGRTLFLVGDPLQSIYRFRDADVRLYLRTAATGVLGNIELTALRLNANFRTTPQVLSWLNHALPRAFAAAGPELPPFRPFAAARTTVPGGGVFVHVTDEPGAAARAVEIVAAHRARVPDATIAVLVRSRAQLGDLPTALVAAGIPIAATDIDPLAEVPVVNDLMALTRALYALTDRTAWLAVLRAPWCGLGLDDLEHLCGDARDALVWDLMGDDARVAALAVGEATRLTEIRKVLGAALGLRGRVHYAELVERTWNALGGPHCIAHDIERRCAARYFDLLAEYEQEGYELTGNALAAHLAAQFASPAPGTGPAVEIMTVHRAKGLEFDVVIVPELQRAVRAEPRVLLVGHTDGERAVFAPLPASGTKSEPIYEFLRRREQRALRAEGYRLLYVAMTRARDAVHLCGVAPEGDRRRGGSFLDMLWPVIGDDFGRPVAAGTGDATAPRPAARRRLQCVASPPLPTPIEPAARVALEFEWASPLAKHIGTVTHALLQRLDATSAATDAARLGLVRARLRALGVTGADLEDAAREVARAIAATLASPRGRWLLDPAHHDVRAEYRLTAMFEGRAVDVVIDRTFVDGDGVRWIVDYKTGTHLGGDRAAFIASEVERYRPQLELYARVFAALEARPIALGLYFPRFDGWRAWRAGEHPDRP